MDFTRRGQLTHAASLILLERWTTWMRAQSLSELTIDGRVSLITRLSHLTGVPPEELELDHVMEFLATAAFSPGTRQTYFGKLRAWFLWLQHIGLRDDNPLALARGPRSHRPVPVMLTQEQVRRLFATNMYRRTRGMITLAAYQGLRVSEIAKFHSDDLDSEGGVLRVYGKGQKDATIPLHPLVAELADSFGPGYWFPQRGENSQGAYGGPMLGRSVSSIVAQVMRRAGVPGSCHSLRHWFASELLRQGVDIRTIQQLMRHSSLQTTERYLHLDDRQRRAGILRLPDVTSYSAGDDA